MAVSAAVKFGRHLKELRIHLCQQSAASQGARDFVEQFYVAMKKENPKFPILVRECSGVEPKVYARFEYGREESAAVSGKTGQEVLDTIKKLAES